MMVNWVQNISEAIEYIEGHLSQEIKIEDVAEAACASPYYFQRLFLVLTGTTVFEYIRNRRLSLAAAELICSDIRVLDLAIKYGYESSESFSRAFKKLHNVNPSQVRKSSVTVQSYPRLVIEVRLKGDEVMKYRIETKPPFSFYGISRTFSTIDGQNFKEIPVFWQNVMQDGSFEKMMVSAKSGECLGVCMPMDPKTQTEFDYVIGAFSDGAVEGYDFHEVPEAQWAVFDVEGPIHPNLQEAWKRIYSEWFPATGFNHATLPEFENYGAGDPNEEGYVMEIWIPVVK